MSADVIQFAKRGAPPENPGNGAREALERAFTRTSDSAELSKADQILLLLWVDGFKIVPID